MTVSLSNLTMSRVSASGKEVPPTGDPYWSSVTLLTETTGTNTQNNKVFKDSSVNNYTITNTGSVNVTQVTQGTFSPTTGGHSGYFTGASQAGLRTQNFSYATGDFTIESWIYPTQILAFTVYTIFAQDANNGLDTGSFAIENSGKLTYNYKTSSNNFVKIQTTELVSTNTWTHVAVSKSGTSIKLFINGVVSYSGTVPASLYQNTTTLTGIGANSQAISLFVGYLSDVRVTTTAVYTANFSVPTAPLTAITDTKLLLNFNNAGIYDATNKNDLLTENTAQVSTAQKKFGTTSMKFSTLGDRLVLPLSTNRQFGTGDFTIEFWFYRNTTGSAQVLYDQRINGTTVAPAIYINNPGGTYGIYYVAGATDAISAAGVVPTVNTWYHVAVSRSGTSTKMFVNGTQVGTTYTDNNNYVATPLYIGSNYAANPVLTGYMQDVRVTNGVARYTANFTAPTEAFPTS